MRRLSEERTKLLFEKLSKYIGDNVKVLVDRPDGIYCFREKKDRVYYVSEKILSLASTVAPDHLMSFGTCFGKFTKSGKFRLHITALHYLAPYAQYKVWLKPSAEQQFLYGHHVAKAGLGRITESTAQYQGVVVFSMNDIPLVHTDKVGTKTTGHEDTFTVYSLRVDFFGVLLIYCTFCITVRIRITEGFGVAAKSTADCKNADPMSTICFHQADIGEYIRSEDTLL